MKLFSAVIFILSGAASGKAQIESTPREIDEPTAIASLAQTRRDSLPNGTGEQMKRIILLIILIVGGASAAQAQIASGGSYTLDKSVIAAGGGASSYQTGTLYTVNGTAGQFAAGAVASGGTYSLQNGFHTAAAMSSTAAVASISGRVLTATGRGIINARITITDNNGQTRVVTTGLRGTYRIESVPAGATFIIQVAAKRFTFAEPVQVLNISGDTPDTNFVARP